MALWCPFTNGYRDGPIRLWRVQMDDRHATLIQNHGESDRGSGLYVDLENLHPNGQTVIQRLVDNWPPKAPALSRISLYVRADQAELWRLWATRRFSNLKVVVKGTQHFSMTSTKNSADIAIATNAIADLILKRISHIVVFSDDSDFISLYAAVRDDPDIALSDGKVPFLWVVTGRKGSLSTTIKQFFPPDELHVVTIKPSDTSTAVTPERPGPTWAKVAEAVLKDTKVGSFKSTDCQPGIKLRWPDHPMASAGTAAFGIEFKNNIWPVLEGAGVKIKNPGKKPIQYEMTSEAKNTLD